MPSHRVCQRFLLFTFFRVSLRPIQSSSKCLGLTEQSGNSDAHIYVCICWVAIANMNALVLERAIVTMLGEERVASIRAGWQDLQTPFCFSRHHQLPDLARSYSARMSTYERRRRDESLSEVPSNN